MSYQTTNQKLSDLIQTDTAAQMDVSANIFGRHGERGSTRELAGDQILEQAEVSLLEEWDKDEWINDLYANVYFKKVTKCTMVVDPQSKHNIAGLEMEIQGLKSWCERKAEEYPEQVLERAREVQEDIYHEVDIQNFCAAQEREPQLFVDSRTANQAWIEQVLVDMDNMSIDQLLTLKEVTDSLAVKAKAKWLITEKQAAEYRVVCAKIARLHKNTKYSKELWKQFENSIWIATQGNVTEGSKADEWFSVPQKVRDLLFCLPARRNELKAILMAAHDDMRAGIISKLKAERKAFLAREDDPWGILEIQRGEDLSFQLEDGSYLPGSCIELKYVHNNGVVD